jgi:hypothetical protein
MAGGSSEPKAATKGSSEPAVEVSMGRDAPCLRGPGTTETGSSEPATGVFIGHEAPRPPGLPVQPLKALRSSKWRQTTGRRCAGFGCRRLLAFGRTGASGRPFGADSDGIRRGTAATWRWLRSATGGRESKAFGNRHVSLSPLGVRSRRGRPGRSFDRGARVSASSGVPARASSRVTLPALGSLLPKAERNARWSAVTHRVSARQGAILREGLDCTTATRRAVRRGVQGGKGDPSRTSKACSPCTGVVVGVLVAALARGHRDHRRSPVFGVNEGRGTARGSKGLAVGGAKRRLPQWGWSPGHTSKSGQSS